MGTRNKHIQTKMKRPKMECCIEGEDLISELPDDILVRVLSLLAPQEVIRCGALSRRWITLPKLVPMTLKFVRKYIFPSETEETNFVNHVNDVLASYPGETLAELTISYHLCVVDHPLDLCSQWIQFAMGKRVKKLDLDLSNCIREVSFHKYQFPPIPYHQSRSRSQTVCLPMCTSLSDLRLHSVNVTNEHIEHFLKCCPFLQSLCVIGSESLTSVKVHGPIQLKFLEIQYCNNLQFFEISTPDLISFKYRQHQVTSMPLKCAPQLNEMAISDGFYDFLLDNFRMFTSYFALIETLSLGVVRVNSPEFRLPIGIPTLRNLKHLTVQVMIHDNNSLMCFVPWIEASPLLRRFVFKRIGQWMPLETRRKSVKPRLCPHQLLKEVEFVGFIGDLLDTDLVMYIIENAVNLDKIIFDCRNPRFMTTYSNGPVCLKRSHGRVRAKTFQSMLSSAVESVLIP